MVARVRSKPPTVHNPYRGCRTTVPRFKPSERVPPYGLRSPPFDACNLCVWRRCKTAGTTYHKRVQVGFSAPLTDAAMTQLSTAWESKDCWLLLFVFFSPYFSRNSLVCQPSLRWTGNPIPRRRRYKCSLPTCTGLNDPFHLPPLPWRVTARTSSTTAAVSGRIFCKCHDHARFGFPATPC